MYIGKVDYLKQNTNSININKNNYSMLNISRDLKFLYNIGTLKAV
jgi:hypothetical protein